MRAVLATIVVAAALAPGAPAALASEGMPVYYVALGDSLAT